MKRLRLLKAIVRTIGALSQGIGHMAAYLIPVMMLVMTYEVIARYLFESPTIWAMEASQYLFLTTTALGGAHLLLQQRHVRVSLLYDRLGSRQRAIADVLTSLFFFSFIGALLRSNWSMMVESISHLDHSPSYWAPPIYPVYVVMTVGVALLLLQGVANLIRNLGTAVTGQEDWLDLPPEKDPDEVV